MIGSFWNLCRACPSMPIDKQLHSEYRSTYTWHEYTGPHQEHTVVRRAPQAPPTSTKQAIAKLQSAKSTEDENIEGPTLEPPLPRRKKCPELAYKTHEFITAADGGGIDAVDTNVVADKVREVAASAALPPSQLSKAISRISTEYRLQFAWPRRSQLTNGDAVGPVAAAGGAGGTAGPPRKSLSMGALKQGIGPTGPAPVHKKRPGDVDHKRDGAQASELEPLVGHTDTVDGVVPEGDEREEEINEVKVTFRKKKTTDKGVTLVSGDNAAKTRRKLLGKSFPTSEMGELRRLADEYKHRDWGSGLASEEEVSLWKHVTNNHSLNALSLARSVTKEEKDKENTRKIAPSMTMPPAGRPSSVQARPSHGILQDDIKADNEKAIARARKDFLIRHHLDRTTGVGDGALLPSPTREKLEPVVPRRRDDSKETRDEIQPKTKSSPKSSPRTGRSQSLGPMASERRSPKRQPPPRAPSVSKDAKEKEKEQKDKEAREKSVEPERHPRPTAGGRGVRWSIREPSSIQYTTSSCSSTCEPPIPPLPPPPSGPGPTPLHKTRPSPRAHRKLTAEPQVNGDAGTGGESSVASTPQSQSAGSVVSAPIAASHVAPWVDDEPVVKSPPEPTRVKSPEQMIMRSPEPVNWTVPLDTGKTFTVTQNVREGEPLTRPHSEAKTWGGSSFPSAPQSAPPELAAQHKSQQHSQHSGYKSPESESVSLGSFSGLNGHKDLDSERDSPLPSNVHSTPTPTQSDKSSIIAGIEEVAVKEEQRAEQPVATSIKPVAGTNLRCLEDPVFEFERSKNAEGTSSVSAPAAGGPAASAAAAAAAAAAAGGTPSAQTGYRVLEAESPTGPGGASGAGTAAGYHVLGAPALSPGSAQRTVASDVLEKARNRFDKFWGKGGPENQA